jgi:DNA-binding NarL/FixJ family response regulator
VLAFVADGLPNKLIAHVLGVTEQTVKRHVSALLLLFNAPNRAGLVRRAAQCGALRLSNNH